MADDLIAPGTHGGEQSMRGVWQCRGGVERRFNKARMMTRHTPQEVNSNHIHILKIEGLPLNEVPHIVALKEG